MKRRPAVTLIEVLMAIFVMGIGLMGLMTLFPVGAISMAQAILDDQAANAAFNAASIAEAQGLRSRITTNYTHPAGHTATQADWPSYPVYIDPIGSTAGAFLGTFPKVSLGIPRVTTVPWLPNLLGAPTALRTSKLRWFSLQDSLVFDDNGAALSPDGGTSIQRSNRITWAYMLRRPRASVPEVVDMSIIVYNNRPLLAPVSESTYQAQGDLGGNSVLVNWNIGAGQAAPAIRKGTWILDASSEVAPNPGADPTQARRYGPIHSNFYRVLGVINLSPTQGVIALELDQTLRAPVNLIVVMDNVLEVFENAAGRRPF
jgi:hypothetical protein